MQLTKSKLVMYHDKCVDGLSACWSARNKLGDSADYLPVSYGQDPPDVLGKSVYVLDFCFPAHQIEQMADEATGLVVLDHHKTAEEWMRDARHRLKHHPNVLIDFDMERSGCGLTADYFMNRNWFIDYVEDRDLWRFKLPNSKNINAFIQSLPRTFEDYDAAIQSVEVEQANVLGMGALRYVEMYVREMCQQARLVTFDEFQNIPAVNAPYVGISELVGALAATAPFAIGWSQDKTGTYVVSLRSRGDLDVSELAKRYGGGGHRGAAGFSVKGKLPWE